MIRPETYYVTQGWMRSVLNLSGTELVCYAIIFGFSQGEQGTYTGGVQYLQEWSGASKPTVIKALSSLCDKGLIIKLPHGTNCDYVAAELKGKEILPIENERLKNFTKEVKNFNLKGKETLPNNIDINNNINNTIVQSAAADVDESVSKAEQVRRFTAEFAELWKLYPRREGKANALKAYIKARFDGVEMSDVANGIHRYAQYIKEQQTELRYIKLGSTWFNQRCWTDEYKLTSAPSFSANTAEDNAMRQLLYERQQARKRGELNDTAE